jgi:hypothetical protein
VGQRVSSLTKIKDKHGMRICEREMVSGGL